MKKQVNVKAYKRRTKSGKIVTVKAHTAKRDVDATQKPGAGDEYIINASGVKTSLDNIPYNVQTFSDEDFKEWYKFNEWDTPRSKWPKAVREVDDRLKQSMTKKNYDKYCAMVDESWSARGSMKALRQYSSYCKNGSPAQEKSKIKRSAVASTDTNKDIDGVTSERKAMIVKNIRESMSSGSFKPSPHALSKAYQSGDKQLIKDVEDAVRDYINREGTKHPEALDNTIKSAEFGIAYSRNQLKEENLNRLPKTLSTNMMKIERENNIKAHEWIKAECKRLQKDLKKKGYNSSILKEMKETYSSPDDRPKMTKSQQMKYDTLADFNRAGLNLTSRVSGVSRKMGGGVIIEHSGMSIPEKTRLNYIATQQGYTVGDWSGHEYYLQKKQPEPKKQVSKSSSEDYYTKQTRYLMSEVKNAVERANKNMISGWSSNFYAPSYKELQSFVRKIKGTLPKGINVKIRKYSDYKEGSRGSYGSIIVETDPNIITGSYDIDYNK